MLTRSRFERTPSIRTCFPERFSDPNSDDSLQNSSLQNSSWKSYTSQDRHDQNPSFVQSPVDNHLNVEELLLSKIPPGNSAPVPSKLISQQTVSIHIANHANTTSTNAAPPIQVHDKFAVPEPPPSPSTLPSSFLRVGNRTSTRLTLYVPLYRAALRGDWKKAKEFLNLHPGAVNLRITKGSETVLHIAAGAKHISFVEEVVKLMSVSDLALRNKFNSTALCFAAASGITRIAEVMVTKNKDLPSIRGNKGVTPLHIAALFGHRDMVWYLFKVTDNHDLTQEDYIGLLIASISTHMFDVALHIIQCQPGLAILRDPNEETALHVLARKHSAFASKTELGIWQSFVYPWINVQLPAKSSCPSSRYSFKFHQVFLCLLGQLWRVIEAIVPGIKVVHEKKLLHVQAVQLTKLLWEQILLLEDSQIAELLRRASKPLFVAAEFGIVELIVELLQSYPDLIWKVDEQSRTIFHIAVVHRQEKIFNLIHDIGAHKDMITSYKDDKNLNILHLAGKIAPTNRLKTVSGAALQMQRELLWFKEVEKNVQPLYREMRDNNGRTPSMLFTEEHAKLVKEGEKWMKNTASSCMLVATLITTVMFAAIFTVPGGNDNVKGTPIFLGTKSFIIFSISDAFALFSSVTSILMFLSILTSRYSEEDFLESLPKRLIIGLASLFFSIASMLVAFGATFFIVLGHRLAWIVIPVALIACIPVTLFAFLQFPCNTRVLKMIEILFTLCEA